MGWQVPPLWHTSSWHTGGTAGEGLREVSMESTPSDPPEGAVKEDVADLDL